jgi:Nuclease-related domain
MDDGRVNEVDVLVLTPAGLVLVEIKSRPGTLGGMR